jgi:hypothetical protein
VAGVWVVVEAWEVAVREFDADVVPGLENVVSAICEKEIDLPGYKGYNNILHRSRGFT